VADHWTGPRYLILVRHGTPQRCWNRARSEHPLLGWDAAPLKPSSKRKKEGSDAAYGLAGWLADQLEARSIKVDTIVHGRHLVTQQTAQIYARVLADRKRPVDICRSDTMLDPACKDDGTLYRHCNRSCAFYRQHDGAANRKKRLCARLACLRDQIRQWRDRAEPKQGAHGRSEWHAYLVVGHQPDVTEIGNLFANIPTGVLPIGSAESACIKLARPRRGGCLLFAEWRERRAGRLLWLVTSRDDKLLANLREKIASKFDVAKFFLGALVLNGGLLINQNLWSIDDVAARWFVALGYLFLLLSLGLTVGTLFAYDRLLMPAAFWGADRGSRQPRWYDRRLIPFWGAVHRGTPRWTVTRPPSDEPIVLYYEMVHVWNSLFFPAAACAIAALVLFLCALAQAGLADSFDSAPAVTLLLSLAVLAGAYFYYRDKQPNLGTQD
jgi:phosphohistidine phosphatase SixA